MSSSDSGVDYIYTPLPDAESARRKLAIRIIVALSAAGILLVIAGWIAS